MQKVKKCWKTMADPEGVGGGLTQTQFETKLFHFHWVFSEKSGKINDKSGKVNKSNPPFASLNPLSRNPVSALVLSNHLKGDGSYGTHTVYALREITQTGSKGEQPFLHATHCLDPMIILFKGDNSNRKQGRTTIITCGIQSWPDIYTFQS